jgi:large subunit ribosomal protein L35
MKKKTHSGAKKRFVKKKSGKIKFYQSTKRHHLTKKSSKVKRALRCSSYINKSDISHIKSII